MKKYQHYILIGTLIFTFGHSMVVSAETLQATDSATATRSAAKEDPDVKNIKERVAKTVAESRKKDQRAISGFAEVKDGVIKVKDVRDENAYEVKTDLTQIYQIVGTTKKELKREDIKTDMYLIVTGPIVEKTINANVIFVDETFLIRSGKITEVNKTDYYLKVTTIDKEEFSLDIETGTKQNMLNIKTFETEKIGFSKIKEGDTIHFVVKKTGPNMDLTKRLAASKILVIPQEYFIQ